MDNQNIIVPEIVELNALSEITKAEVDIQISTAKKYPRSIEKFRQDALTMATLDEDIAAACYYKIPRKDIDGTVKNIEGSSVRLAEIIASAWGNIRFGARIIKEDDRFVTAQGVAHDLEKNVCNIIEVKRRITNKRGQKYSDDMIAMTQNAACSIALRNAIFKTIPFVYAKTVYEAAKKTAVGKAENLVNRRKKMVDTFKQLGIQEDKICLIVEKKSIEDIGLAEIENLIGIYNAIKDGETTIDELFGAKNSTGKGDVKMPKAKSETQQVKE